MPFTAVENNQIQIDLVTQCNYTGWTLPLDGTAVHSSCVSGNIILNAYPVTGGKTYQISYLITAISGGNVQSMSPGSNGTAYTTTGLKVETLTPSSNGFISLYSNANCVVTAFNVNVVSNASGTTIVYSPTNSTKRGEHIWTDFRTFYPDYGFSLYTRTILCYNGQMYTSDNGDTQGSTNNFFGTQYQSSIKFVEAKNPQLIKDFEALTYQANQLLITTEDGIETSLGQISTLIDTDFIKTNLAAGGLTVVGYQNDGVYSSSFLGDENDENVVNGAGMRGNWIIIELITNDGSTPLTLFSISVRSKQVFIGSRPLTK